MGAPQQYAGKRDNVVRVRLTDAELVELEQEAQRWMVTVACFVRMVLLGRVPPLAREEG